MRQRWTVPVMPIAVVAALLGGCRSDSDQALDREGRGKYAKIEPGKAGGVLPGKESPARGEELQQGVERMLGLVYLQSQSEVDLATLAEERAQTPAIKAFAAAMRVDHEDLLTSLGELGRSRGLDLPSIVGADPMLSAQCAANLERGEKLRTLSGQDFEGAYMSPQPSTHLLLVKIAEQGRQAAVDPEITGFFTRMATSLRAHRDMALSAISPACGGTGEALTRVARSAPAADAPKMNDLVHPTMGRGVAGNAPAADAPKMNDLVRPMLGQNMKVNTPP